MSKDKVQYLGLDVSRRSRMYTESQKSYIKSTGKLRRPTYSSVIIEAPIDKLLKKLVEQGFAWEKDSMPKAVTKWIHLNPEDIIRRYKLVTRGIIEYYKSVENKNQMGRIVWILKFSAVNTLARKLISKTSLKKIW